MNIYVDIDDTICNGVKDLRYEDARPIYNTIYKINDLYRQGHTITYFTARGALATSTRKDEICKFTRTQLSSWGCLYHELIFSKPPFDLLIDDKAVNTIDQALDFITVNMTRNIL